MPLLRRVPLLAGLMLAAACSAGAPSASPSAPGTPSAAPPTSTTPPSSASAAPTATASFAPSVAPSESPSDAPSVAPTGGAGATLDPSQSDAGVVGEITITNDERAGRDGTHLIVGLDADGSSCSANFDGETYTAVAWYDEAPNGLLHQMAVVVGIDDIPTAEGETTADIDGRVYADFVSESGFGTAYVGDASDDPTTSATIDVTRVGEGLVFNFEVSTWDAIQVTGQMVCAEG